MAVRAIRGAIQINQDERSELLKATAELVTKVLHEKFQEHGHDEHAAPAHGESPPHGAEADHGEKKAH
jgi:hypothetical protein